MKVERACSRFRAEHAFVLQVVAMLCLLTACSAVDLERRDVRQPNKADTVLADCPRTTDLDAEFTTGKYLSDEKDPCLPAHQACLDACRESPCGHGAIGGGCAHLCSGRSEPYLKRAERIRKGNFDEKCHEALSGSGALPL